MKLQWKSVSEEQEKRNSRLRDYKSLIGKCCFIVSSGNSLYRKANTIKNTLSLLIFEISG